MSKPKLAAVVATLSDDRSHRDPSNRVIFLIEISEGYSLPAVQKLLDAQGKATGATFRARYELARFKSMRRLAAWASRKHRNSSTTLQGWNGPFSLSDAA